MEIVLIAYLGSIRQQPLQSFFVIIKCTTIAWGRRREVLLRNFLRRAHEITSAARAAGSGDSLRASVEAAPAPRPAPPRLRRALQSLPCCIWRDSAMSKRKRYEYALSSPNLATIAQMIYALGLWKLRARLKRLDWGFWHTCECFKHLEYKNDIPSFVIHSKYDLTMLLKLLWLLLVIDHLI